MRMIRTAMIIILTMISSSMNLVRATQPIIPTTRTRRCAKLYSSSNNNHIYNPSIKSSITLFIDHHRRNYNNKSYNHYSIISRNGNSVVSTSLSESSSSSYNKSCYKNLKKRSFSTSKLSNSLNVNNNNNEKNGILNNQILISSSQSNIIKRVQLLLQKRKKRYEFQQTIAEGPRIIFDLLSFQKTQTTNAKIIHQIIISTDYFKEYETKLLDHLNNYENSPQIIQATPDVFQLCTDTVTSQGIIAICNIPEYNDNNKNDNNSDSDGQHQQRQEHGTNVSKFYLILDNISDPGNMGTLLRSSVGAGIDGIYLIHNCCDPYSPKAIRSSMASVLYNTIPLIQTYTTWEECYTHLTQQPSNLCSPDRIYAATMYHGTSTNSEDENNTTIRRDAAYYDIDWCNTSDNDNAPTSSAVVIGNEGNGLSADVRHSVMTNKINTVYIPMATAGGGGAGSIIESLNAAICGSIIMFEYNRQKNVYLSSLARDTKQINK